jgi:hypothetical protein
MRTPNPIPAPSSRTAIRNSSALMLFWIVGPVVSRCRVAAAAMNVGTAVAAMMVSTQRIARSVGMSPRRASLDNIHAEARTTSTQTMPSDAFSCPGA